MLVSSFSCYVLNMYADCVIFLKIKTDIIYNIGFYLRVIYSSIKASPLVIHFAAGLPFK